MRIMTASAETMRVRLAERTPLSTKSSGLIFAVMTVSADADTRFMNSPKRKLNCAHGLLKQTDHNHKLQKPQGYTVSAPHVKNREALCKPCLGWGEILRRLRG